MHAESSARVRIAAAGWVEPEPDSGDERRFRFDCTLVGDCPTWTFGQVMDGEFVLSPSPSGSGSQLSETQKKDA